DEQFLARRSLRELPERIERLTQRLEGLSADQATMKAQADDLVTIGGRAALDVVVELGVRLETLPRSVMHDRRVQLGTYRGLRFGMVLHPHYRPEVYLEGAVTRQDSLCREHQGPRAVLNAVERLAGGYATEVRSVQQDLELARKQLADYEGRVGRPFVHA